MELLPNLLMGLYVLVSSVVPSPPPKIPQAPAAIVLPTSQAAEPLQQASEPAASE